MARPGGLEPPTTGLENRCSIRLSYGRAINKRCLSVRKASPVILSPFASLRANCAKDLHPDAGFPGPRDNILRPPEGVLRMTSLTTRYTLTDLVTFTGRFFAAEA